MSAIRPLRPEDIPGVAALRRETFSFSSRQSAEDLERYLELVFFRNPWCDPELPSFVCEGDSGGIVGFIGIVPRPFVIGGRPVRAAVATQFMVAPSARGLTTIRLLRRAFAGRQDLLFSDVPNTAARRIWLGLGGSSAPAYAFHWVAVVKPFNEAAARLGMGPPVRAARLLARPIIALGDALAARLSTGPFRPDELAVSEAPLEVPMICRRLPEIADMRELRPIYEPETFRWLLARVEKKWGEPCVRGFSIRGEDGSEDGWALYRSRPGGVNEVIHLAARPEAGQRVLAHLCRRARSEGARAVRGPVFPRYFSGLPMPGVTVNCNGKGILFHTEDQVVGESIHGGRAFLGGMEGEWWMDF